jgi:hypothetical protein
MLNVRTGGCGGPCKSLSFHTSSCGGVGTVELGVGTGFLDQTEHGICQRTGIIIGDGIADLIGPLREFAREIYRRQSAYSAPFVVQSTFPALEVLARWPDLVGICGPTFFRSGFYCRGRAVNVFRLAPRHLEGRVFPDLLVRFNDVRFDQLFHLRFKVCSRFPSLTVS